MDWGTQQSMPQREPRKRGARHTACAPGEEHLSGSGKVLQRVRDDEYTAQDVASVPEDGARTELRAAAEEGASYEYLDHTADVQLHAWGSSLEAAFANTALAMLNYMTPLSGTALDDEASRPIKIKAEGHDMHTLLYAFLDEVLFIFSTELLVFKEVEVTRLDRESWQIEAIGKGEIFDRQRHASGTEIKAITYSAMQVIEETAQGDVEVFVIVDI